MAKTDQIVLRINPESKKKIERIAENFDLTWNNKGSIGKLLQAIADNDLLVSKNFSKNS